MERPNIGKALKRSQQERDGLVPFFTKYYSRKSPRAELTGWRSAAPSSDRSLQVTVKSPCRVNSRAVLNSSPRYPRLSQPLQSASDPVLHKPSSLLLKVPCVPKTAGLQLQSPRKTEQGFRLPTVRKSVREKKETHNHFQTNEKSLVLHVKNSLRVLTKNVKIPVSSKSLFGTPKHQLSPVNHSEIPSTRASVPSSPRGANESLPVKTLCETREQPSLYVEIDDLLGNKDEEMYETPRKISNEIADSKVELEQVESDEQDMDSEGGSSEDTAARYTLPTVTEVPPQAPPFPVENASSSSRSVSPDVSDLPAKSDSNPPSSPLIPRKRLTTRIPESKISIPKLPLEVTPHDSPTIYPPRRERLHTIIPAALKATTTLHEIPAEVPTSPIHREQTMHTPGKTKKKPTALRGFIGKIGSGIPQLTVEVSEWQEVSPMLEQNIYVFEHSASEEVKQEEAGMQKPTGLGAFRPRKISENAPARKESHLPVTSHFTKLATQRTNASRKLSSPKEDVTPTGFHTPRSAVNSVSPKETPKVTPKGTPRATPRLIPPSRTLRTPVGEKRLSSSSGSDEYDDEIGEIAKSKATTRPRKMTLPIEIAAKMGSDLSDKEAKSPTSQSQFRRASIAFDHGSPLMSFLTKERQVLKTTDTDPETFFLPFPETQPNKIDTDIKRPLKPRPRVSQIRPRDSVIIRTRIVDFASVGAKDPFDMFLRQLAHSLLNIIEDVVEDQSNKEEGEEAGNVEKTASLESLPQSVSKENTQLLEIFQRAKTNPATRNLINSPDYARKLLQHLSTYPQSPSNDSSSEQEDSESSEDEHELHKVRRQRDKMTDYELKHLNMLKKIAEDLLKGTEGSERFQGLEIPPLPGLEESEKKWEGKEKEGGGDLWNYASGEEDLGQVQDLLSGLFAGYSDEDFTAFMPSCSLVLPQMSSEKEVPLPESVDPDLDNYQSYLLRRHFQAICQLKPELLVALEKHKASLHQIDLKQLRPEELFQLISTLTAKKKRKVQTLKQRQGQQFVKLRAKQAATFSNLHPSRMQELRKEGSSECIPSQPDYSSRSYSERVYLRMKNSEPEYRFPSPKSRPAAVALSDETEKK